ncbi:phenylalanine--tRNA ligase subunit beta [Aureibacter tunicatorum]|uniref:Phenylalanine--tRNA ligase beta subunit n=1 Tax=Aureibacter tunicatorum TaxID=866807 RepID=A0AAE3XPD0_9BACT|nr:phenylalanine--tRNA ligase subunit beta [Aureibacter tunicatorum]MDR6240185.1 phenylalanyl-tRNA synthetase beta chain [Aureibacter tunicatorum]BDD05934.1 phenylalanine--tRNA ligase beta subunit [Aureibacter tunicatorum]
MKISFNWLKEYIKIDDSPEIISDVLTATGLEVEGLSEFEQVKGGLKGLVIGEVLTCEKHPGADKLSKTTVDIGVEIVPIVCGAPNVAAGQKVVVAKVGSTLYPEGHEPFTIKKAKIRGEQSMGMICAEDEIGLGTSHDGIMVLDTDLPNGTPAAEYFELDSDYTIEIGLTPNRADAMSHIGVARDIRAVQGNDVNWPNISSFDMETIADEQNIEISVENFDACPRYAGLTIDNIKVEPSPEWLQNRLKAIGLSPINNVVDITNYVLHETGQPLHAFDLREVKGNKVIVKTLPEGTIFKTLDGEERKLKSNDLMICNEEKPMCIAGVFGGLESGVKDDTTSIFLESAYFSPDWVRKTSQNHTLKTDASFRFERGIDPNITIFALKRAALLIKEIAGGKITSKVQDIYPNKIEDFKVPVKFRNIDRLIGKTLDRQLIHQILTRLDIKTSEETSEGFIATVPAYRVDVTREADVIEEILRIYGYDNIEVSEHLSSNFLSEYPAHEPFKLERSTSQQLVSLGYNELITNSLTSSKYNEHTTHVNSEENINILNKLSEELDILRQTMLFNHLEVISHNINRQQKDLKLFEFGKTYKKVGEKYIEEANLCICISGNKNTENWQKTSEKVTYYDLHGDILNIFNKFNLKGINIEKTELDILEYGAVYKLNNKVIAYAGLVKKQIAKAFGIKQDIFYAEIKWDSLLKTVKADKTFEPISKFPAVRRDLSLVIDKSITYEQIKGIAEKSAGKLLSSINVFDTYEGDKIDSGKKAYALSFILEDKTKTLNDKTIDKAMNKLIKAFEFQIGAHIRK